MKILHEKPGLLRSVLSILREIKYLVLTNQIARLKSAMHYALNVRTSFISMCATISEVSLASCCTCEKWYNMHVKGISLDFIMHRRQHIVHNVDSKSRLTEDNR